VSFRWRPSRSSNSVWRGTSWPGGRLALAVIAVATVIAAVGITFAVQNYRNAKQDVRAEQAALARDTAVEASSLVAIRLEYLTGIAATDPVTSGDRPAMRTLFKAMLGHRLVVDDIGWVRADGKGVVVAGQSPSQTANVDLSGRRYVEIVRETERPYVSDAILTSGSRVPAIVLAVPAFDRAHRLTGIVTGILRLDDLRPALRALRLGDTMQIVDRQGHVVIDAARTSTLRRVDNLALLRELQTTGSGIRDGIVGLTGRSDQLVAFAGSSDTGWMVVVSEPVASVYGPARDALINDVVRWLGLLVGVAGLAFLGGRMLERSTRERVTRTSDFVAAASRMSAATTVSEISEIYNEAVVRALGSVSATVAVVQQNEIVPYFAAGTRNEELWRRLPWESPLGAAIVTRTRVQAESPDALRRRFPTIIDGLAKDKIKVAAICAVPFPAGPVRGGAAALFEHPRRLSEQEWLLLEAYANQVAPAIDRAQLYEAERRQRLRAEEAERREHAVATRLQRALLPERVVEDPRLTVTARYQPGTAYLTVGGDWYDTLALPGGRVALTIGDVAGHGIDAAAAMGRIRSAIQAFSQAMPAPGTVLGQLEVFASRFAELDFLTLCHAVLDPATGAIDYASAGHPPILVVDAQGNPFFLEEGRSPPLPDRAPRPTAHAVLPSGSRLILYSDGLIERRGESPDTGLARLADWSRELRPRPSDEFADELLRHMSDGDDYTDDVALLVVDLNGVGHAGALV